MYHRAGHMEKAPRQRVIQSNHEKKVAHIEIIIFKWI